MQTGSNENVENQNTFVRVLLSVGRALLILGLLFYVLYHLTNGFSADMKTETMYIWNEEILLNTDGVIVRDETPVSGASGGVVSYRFANGQRVSKGARIAMVYSGSKDAETVARVAEIDKIIELLETADIDGDTQISDGISAGREIESRLAYISECMSRGDYAAAVADKDLLVKAFVRRSTIISDSGEDVKAQLASLEAERASLASSLGGSSAVNAALSGYFYNHADGGEGVFDYDSIDELKPSEYYELRSALDNTDSDAMGKIVALPKWYFICPVSKEESIGLEIGKKYTVEFGLSDMRIDMTLSSKNEESGEVLLAFSSVEMPDGFDFERIQRASIVRETVSGFRVPSSALRMVDGTVGVYIRSGNTVKFRVAEVLYESGAYSFVGPDTEAKTLYSADTDETNDIYCKGLSLYDNVIVGGARELSPDRIVN